MRDEPASEIARSSAIQHIIFDWVKWRGSLRTSQMPESGVIQISQTRSAISASRVATSRSSRLPALA